MPERTPWLRGNTRRLADVVLPELPGPCRGALWPEIPRARILLVPVLSLVAVLTGWFFAAVSGWPAAVGGAAVSAGNGMWLHRRAWAPGLTHLLTWAAPTVVLAPMAALGSLSPDGLVLWAPVTILLAAALAMSQDPRLASDQSRHGR